jgi:hypothetical protein
MIIQILVEVELGKTGGKFASRSDLEELIIEEIEATLPSEIETDEATYEVVSTSIEVQAPAKKK